MYNTTMSYHENYSINDILKDRARIGIIRGGQTPEYELSLKTGAEILKRLQDNLGYDAFDVLVDKNGDWHVNGKQIHADYLGDYIDLAWIAIHGDNGSVQALLENLGIPFLGSDSVTSELTFNRGKLKKRLKDLGLQTPQHIQLSNMYTGDMDEETRSSYIENRALEIFGALPGPWVIKPVAFSARFHTYLARTFPELVTALRIISMDVDDVLVEEYISGTEYVSGVVPEFRGKDRYVVPPHEVKHNKDLLTHHTVRLGEFDMIPASRMSPKIKELVEKLSEELHQDFNIGDTGVFHFIMSPKGLYVISVQDNPELHDYAPLFKGLEHVGADADDFIHSRVARLLRKRK